ncbi:uncharacterized protein BT62DRAFT_921530 [Guyanagaster necrorhizus]|uniref:Uncharacterized protein n=1 Tax=Guyanagaster necrorhizus TaxID=856835 RepID=A0A9P7VMD0_9AGAR|nr:uncharacterized protein BT62DRAFT_921530 [Guyanagaster necrorhizus MCA 3950]KAG7443863.1 hypothetical protein BT62DRAFT_921530 [Guyanagaster necrorhizus MCA 3950]
MHRNLTKRKRWNHVEVFSGQTDAAVQNYNGKLPTSYSDVPESCPKVDVTLMRLPTPEGQRKIIESLMDVTPDHSVKNSLIAPLLSSREKASQINIETKVAGCQVQEPARVAGKFGMTEEGGRDGRKAANRALCHTNVQTRKPVLNLSGNVTSRGYLFSNDLVDGTSMVALPTEFLFLT